VRELVAWERRKSIIKRRNRLAGLTATQRGVLGELLAGDPARRARARALLEAFELERQTANDEPTDHVLRARAWAAQQGERFPF
jgi:hypothetical protein